MSTRFLQKLLDEAIEIIEADIRDELNAQATIATFDYKVIKKAVYNQLRFTLDRGKGQAKYSAWASLTPQQKKDALDFIEKESVKIMKDLYISYKKLKNPGVSVAVTGSPKRFTISVVTTNKANIEKRIGKGGRTIDIASFETVKDGYKSIVNKLWDNIATWLEQNSNVEDKELRSEQNKFALEHSLGESVSERRVGKGIDYLYNSINGVVKSEAKTEKIFKKLGLEALLQYKSLADRTDIKVFLGSASKNSRQGTVIERKIVEEAKEDIQNAIYFWATDEKVERWAGSDDRITIESKKIIKSFEDNIKEGKNLKKTTRNNTKLKLSKKKVKGKAKLPVKIRKKDTKLISTSRPKRVGGSQRVEAESTVALAALINQKLSEVVAKNMRYPALRYRTGRFARSVRVMEVTKTTKGFPSVGYTYMKRPYQVFEPGATSKAPWSSLASSDRDPRKLIDRSIREIAAKLLIGRFYTRRL